ncbi:MAG TPA: ketopantoate reductase family protein [archaeon]|nr:ketopantoate reductase family protein [archaeon]
MTFSKIYIFGAGVIGLSIGIPLSKKSEVELIGRKKIVQKLKSGEFKVNGKKVQLNERLKAKTHLNKIPEKSLTIVAVKAVDLKKSLKQIKNFLMKDTLLLFLQNGYGIKEEVKSVINLNNSVFGIALHGGQFLANGNLEVKEPLIQLEENKNSVKVNKLFKAAGINSSPEKNFNKIIWFKLSLNCVVNPLSALFKLKDCEVAEPELADLRKELFDEARKVALKEGVIIPKNYLNKFEKVLKNYTNYSSMAQDTMNKRKTEIDFINGAIARLGKKQGVPTPVNEKIVSMIKELEVNLQGSG